MSIKSTLCLSVSSVILASAVHAAEIGTLSFPNINARTVSENNKNFQIASMQFLPDMETAGGSSFSGNSLSSDYSSGSTVAAKGCPEGYQTGGCSGDTPFKVSSTRAENGNTCYKCRAFEASDCENDGYHLQSYWDALKPQAALKLPQESMFAQLFGNIFGFRSAKAVMSVNDSNQAVNFMDNRLVDGSGGGGSSGGGTSGNTPNQSTNEDDKLINNTVDDDSTSGPVHTNILTECEISARKVLDVEVAAGDLYTFNKTGECKYNSSYIKGEWIATCDSTIYKYDSSNCSNILAGKKCGQKWSGCYKCSDLYSITNASVCKYPLPGVYEPGQTKVGTSDISVNSCKKTAEGCLYNCLFWFELACDTSLYPYTSSNCSGTLGGSSCTSGTVKRYETCTTCSGYTYTTANCSGILGGGTCGGKYKTCTACTSPKTANAARTACNCPSEYNKTCSGSQVGSGMSCDGKYKLCTAASSGGGYFSSSDDRFNCGPQGSMC